MICPNGHELVTEDQYAGRKVRCPHCQVIVIVPTPASAAIQAVPVQPAAVPPHAIVQSTEEIEELEELQELEPLDEDRPRRRRRYRDEDDDHEEERPRKKKKKKGTMTRQQLGMTNLGLGFYYFKIITILVGLFIISLGTIATMAVGVQAAQGQLEGARGSAVLVGLILMLGSIAVSFVAPGLGITGGILCCWVPSRTGAKPLVITSMALDSAGLVLPIISIIVVGAGTALGGYAGGAAGGMAGLVFALLSPFCTLAGFILFMLFLRQLAYFLDESGAGDEAMAIIIHSLLLLFGGPIGLFVLLVIAASLSRDRQSATAVGCVFSLVIIGLAIAWIVFAIKLLFRILQLIGSLRQILRSRFGV
jgi:hypothetical protein